MQRERGRTDPLILDLWPPHCEGVIFVAGSQPVCGHLLQQPWEAQSLSLSVKNPPCPDCTLWEWVSLTSRDLGFSPSLGFQEVPPHLALALGGPELRRCDSSPA